MTKNKNLVVKTNRLIRAFQVLSLPEIRLIQLAIVDARESGRGLSAKTPLTISPKRYSDMFEVTWERAYQVLKEAEEKLWIREFTIIDDDYDNEEVTHRWIQSKLKYDDKHSFIKITLSNAVVSEISRLDGVDDFFTSYYLEQTINFKSQYSVRLYELLISWKNFQGDIPVFELENFRYQLGLDVNEYKKMNNLKARVLHKAISEINEYSDLSVSYEQIKVGKKIIGFQFKIEKSNEANKKELKLMSQLTKPLNEKQASLFSKIIVDYCTKNPSKGIVHDLVEKLPSHIKYAKSWFESKNDIQEELKKKSGFFVFKDILLDLNYKEK